MIHKEGHTWAHVKAWADARIADLQRANEQSGLDLAKTENLRGKIAVLKELLALPDKQEARTVEIEPYET